MLFYGEEPDFEDERPEFAGDEESVVFAVIGNAVEHVNGVFVLFGVEDSCEVNPGEEFSVLGRDDGDAVLLPDVGVDSAFDKLKLIESDDWSVIVSDVEAAYGFKGVGVKQVEGCGAVADYEAVGVGGDAPAFGGVCEGSQ